MVLATNFDSGFYNLAPTYPTGFGAALSFITPFTHRTNISYAELLMEIYKWLRDQHLPMLDGVLKEFKELIEKNNEDQLKIIADFEILMNGRFDEFVKEITDLVNAINNRTGNVEVQHVFLDSDKTVELDKTWPNNHILNYRVLQDSVGKRVLSLGENIIGNVVISPDPNTETKFSLWPDGNGKFYAVQNMDNYFYSTVYGYDAMASGRYVGTPARNNEAYGKRALYNLRKGRYNTMMGLEAGYSLDGFGFSEAQMNATRNSGFGSNTQRFNKTGYNNVSMGRNSMQCLTTAANNVAIGAGAMSGYAHVGYDGEIINVMPKNPDKNVGIGTNALFNTSGIDNTMIGTYAGQNIKNLHNNVGVGRNALANLDVESADNGFVKRELRTAAGLTISNGVMTLTLTDHPFVVGSLIYYTHSGYESQFYYVKKVVDFENVILDWDYPETLNLATSTVNIEYYTLPTDDFGRSRGWNTAVGTFALTNMRGSVYGTNENGLSTAIGYRALAENVDGSPAYNVWHCVGLGAATKASGTNQVLLGSESTTPYAYQPLQVRSDERDKADIADNELGLNFIEKLRPVQYRWDRRDSYASENHEKNREFGYRDGSKKGSRLHNGFIAQDVKAVADSMNVDFAGYQDHSVNGGLDVKSLAYEEFISPMVKAIQELSARVKELEGK